MPALSASPAWQALQAHSDELKNRGFRIQEEFQNPDRFESFSLIHDQLLLDYSKNLCNSKTIELLLQLADQQKVTDAINDMFAGVEINNTEQRPALHTALRIPAESNTRQEVVACLNKMNDFVAAVHGGDWKGHAGQSITDVVNIGIGGSDLGPAMVTEALQNYSSAHVQLHFVSNVDPQHAESVLATLNPATTLFIIASKSFRTQETHANAELARNWFLQSCEDESQIAKHFVAITTNLEAAQKFGIDPENLFPMWDWVGGRYSLWSAIGLSIALSIGMNSFRDLLAGAHSMDIHFQTAELKNNMPVLLALLSVWYSGFFAARSNAVVPYSHALRQLPAFMQQLSMESLGKSVTKDGNSLDTNSGEVIWGTEGTNGQHSFFQLLHQGTDLIPVDFIALAKGSSPNNEPQHKQLLANCLSQSKGLMDGKLNTDSTHRHYEGNRPSNTLLLAELNPYNLGSLLALYEHKIYVQSVIWGINAFDQWGVELGKEIAGSVEHAFENEEERMKLDSSSKGLLSQISEWS